MENGRPRAFEAPGPRAPIPEARLMLAILDDALATYRTEAGRPGLKHRRRAAEAEEWLFSDDIRWPFSFLNVCHTLGIDEGWIRARLRPRADANGVAVNLRRPEMPQTAGRRWTPRAGGPALAPALASMARR